METLLERFFGRNSRGLSRYYKNNAKKNVYNRLGGFCADKFPGEIM